MSIYLKPNELKIKNEQGQYVGLNIAAEGSVQDYLDAIEAKGLETIDNIPSDYTTLSEEVDDLRDDLQQMNLTKFDLSDRIAKGVDDQGNEIEGAIIEGLLEDISGNFPLNKNMASGTYSHAQGMGTIASGRAAHAEGYNTTASGARAHSEGQQTAASGSFTHVEGYGTIANHRSQHVFGEYNIVDQSNNNNTEKGNYIEIIGNGQGNAARSNARTLDWSGNEKIAGSLTLGMGTANETTITAAQLATLVSLTSAQGVNF